MAVSAITVTLGVDLGEGKFNSKVSYPADPVALATTADTDVGVIVTDMTTAFTAQDIFGNALVAITGDSYSNTTHLWTTGGATGLTHAQVVTLMALFNTASSDFVLAQTAAVAAKAATVAAKAPLGGNLVVLVDTVAITTSNGMKAAVEKALRAAKNIGIVQP